MKKILYFIILTVFIFGNAVASGGRPKKHDHDSAQAISIIYRESGPILKAFSEFATIYILDIDGNLYIQEADEDGFLDFDLFPSKLSNGKHYIKITPTNNVGEAPPVEFELQISGKNPQLWQIILIKKLVKSNPEYTGYFSEDLAIYVYPSK